MATVAIYVVGLAFIVLIAALHIASARHDRHAADEAREQHKRLWLKRRGSA